MKKLIFFLMVCMLYSCVHIRMDDSIDLGSNYRYIQDYPQTIIYHKQEKYNGIGQEIVLPLVQEYKFNEQFIVAKSKNMKNDKLYYWIIDKRNQKVFGNLGETEFNALFQKKGLSPDLIL